MAAAVPWCLIGSDGHGAARLKDKEEADPEMFLADIIVTNLFRFDCQLELMCLANGENAVMACCCSNQRI